DGPVSICAESLSLGDYRRLEIGTRLRFESLCVITIFVLCGQI
ncbi:unnamed protein product, partial [Brassica oleracea]